MPVPERLETYLSRTKRSVEAFRDRSVVVVTMDIDWASEACIADALDLIARRGIKPTCFATHDSSEIKARMSAGSIEVGLHPNFLSGSSHGESEIEVFSHLSDMYPGASGFRSHSFADSSRVTSTARDFGMTYDSNSCDFLATDLTPIWHWLGLWRFPVFWEDDIHWSALADWNLGPVAKALRAPGLKVLNVHPFNQALNIPSPEFYQANKSIAGTIDASELRGLRYDGVGCRTFLEGLLDDAIDGRLEIATLSDLVTELGA